jgi:hypothetical protein
MGEVDTAAISDRLNRLVKLAMDTGEAGSIEEAEKLFSGYRLAVAIGPEARHSPTQQAALLTIVNTGRRSLLGGIEVEGIAGMPLMVSLPPYKSLEEAVAGLGGRVVRKANQDAPLVIVGDCAVDAARPFAIRITFDGWTAGIVPIEGDMRLGERHEFIPSGVLSGALAVAEAFQHLRGNQSAAGRRQTGLSLWRPEVDWRERDAIGPVINRLPSALWLIGLGNLGQAYLWTIGMLAYATPGEVQIVLQDFDVLAESNDSTSLLTQKEVIGIRKTRAMAAWAEVRGFKTDIVERRFAADFHVADHEPPVALCGVDNLLARSALEDVGFARIIEAGLGSGTSDFLGFRTHVFPGSRKARNVWNSSGEGQNIHIDLPAYRSLADAGLDRCGLTQLAGRTIGAPFVGATAAAVVIAELLRLVNGAHAYDFIDGHLRDLNHRTVISARDLMPLNPGTTAVIST